VNYLTVLDLIIVQLLKIVTPTVHIWVDFSGPVLTTGRSWWWKPRWVTGTQYWPWWGEHQRGDGPWKKGR